MITDAVSPPGTGGLDRPRRPPRARWRDFFPLRRAFGADARDIMIHLARNRGPFVRTRLPMHIYFVSDPALMMRSRIRCLAR